jgi:hypothetical protein
MTVIVDGDGNVSSSGFSDSNNSNNLLITY